MTEDEVVAVLAGLDEIVKKCESEMRMNYPDSQSTRTAAEIKREVIVSINAMRKAMGWSPIE